MSKSKYIPTEVDKELIRLLIRVYRDYDFVTNMWINLENENNRANMIQWLRNNPDANHVNVIEQMLEITMRGDLVEQAFYEINPELKH